MFEEIRDGALGKEPWDAGRGTKLAMATDFRAAANRLPANWQASGWSLYCVSAGMSQTATQIERLVGRSLAMCVHPYAAWRLHSSRGRAFVFVAYAAAGYALVLGVLQLASF